MLGQMSPYLLFGFLMAGILSVCVSPALVERHLGGRGLMPVLKATLFGIPLPLCSCSVIPVSASIRRHGASPAATSSFLLSTPQTGVDSILVTWSLLGPVMAVFRPVAALVTGLIGGGLVQAFGERGNGPNDQESNVPVCTESCCSGQPSSNVVARVLRYGFVTLPRDIGIPLLVGAVVAGAIASLVPADALKPYLGGGVMAIVVMMIAGIPIYVCATASVPIAAGFMHLGASPGAALAFLIAGPATNAATITTIWKLLGRRTAGLYLVTVAIGALVCGLALDGLMPFVGDYMPKTGAQHHHEMAPDWTVHLWAITLLAVVAVSFIVGYRLEKQRPSAQNEGLVSDDTTTDRQLRLRVQGMTCGHCAETVRRTLATVDGVEHVDVSVGTGQAIVVGDQLDHEQLVAAITDLGYRAEVIADETDARC